MSFSGFTISVSGCESIMRKKIELYRDNYPYVQLFFAQMPDVNASLCVLPADMVPRYFSDDPGRLLHAPALAYGPAAAMALSLAAGCNDYMCAPWTPVEFFERACRCCRTAAVEIDGYRLSSDFGMLHCIKNDSAAGVVAASVKLTRSEEIILKTLSLNKGSYLDRDLLTALLDLNKAEGSRAVDMHVSRLRNKISKLCTQSGIKHSDGPIRSATGCGWAIL